MAVSEVWCSTAVTSISEATYKAVSSNVVLISGKGQQ